MVRYKSSPWLVSAALAAALSLAVTGAATGAATGADDTGDATQKITEAVSAAALQKHLQAFEDIAQAHGGNRADGTEGYRASVEYVVEKLREAGYDPQVQSFRTPYSDHDDHFDHSEQRESYNVLADTGSGDPASTVVVGAHLDSVPEGPGINDNASGAAGILAVAEALAGTELQNAVRFAWWGAEEIDLLGSQHYVDDLAGNDPAALEDISLYLNFDMIGSPNYGRFVYDGSGAPAGSREIEDAFHEYFDSVGLEVGRTEFDDGSDYAAFVDAGIPSGGLYTGADELMSERDADRFGGRAEEPHDACYHRSCDDLANIDLQGFEQMSDAAAAVVLRYATSAHGTGTPGLPATGAPGDLPGVLGPFAAGVLAVGAVALATAGAMRRDGRTARHPQRGPD